LTQDVGVVAQQVGRSALADDATRPIGGRGREAEIGYPGKIETDGSIEAGAQNLPGNWESSRFNLPTNFVKPFRASVA
jgi:hypothetical protein